MRKKNCVALEQTLVLLKQQSRKSTVLDHYLPDGRYSSGFMTDNEKASSLGDIVCEQFLLFS